MNQNSRQELVKIIESKDKEIAALKEELQYLLDVICYIQEKVNKITTSN